MEENLEIEFKILIDKDTYQQIINDHKIDRSYQQTNYYLMHPVLSELKYSLRIREKNNQYELTLKQPQTKGNLETNLIISKELKNKIIDHELINNEVYKKVKDYSKNRSDLNTYYKVGKLLNDAGKSYGEGIIK